MQRLISFEYRKLFRAKSLYICAAVAAGLSILTVIILYYSTEILNDIADTRLVGGNAWELACQSLSSPLPTLMAIMASLIICTEYVSGTVKNVLSRGYSRAGIYASQVVSSITALVIFCAAACAASLILGGSLMEWGTANIACLISQLCVLMGYTGLYCLFSVLIRKTGGSIAVNIFAVQIVGTFFNLADALFYFFRGRGAAGSMFEATFASNYWLSGLLTRASYFDADASEYLTAALIGLAYAVLFFALGYIAVRRRDA